MFSPVQVDFKELVEIRHYATARFVWVLRERSELLKWEMEPRILKWSVVIRVNRQEGDFLKRGVSLRVSVFWSRRGIRPVLFILLYMV